MAQSLNDLYEELKKVRSYLIKIGPNRRQGNVLQTKLSQANVLFEKYSQWLLSYNELSKGKIKSDQKLLYENACRKIEALYSEIFNSCTESVESKSGTKMDTFDLKTALNLLPVVSNDETSIK